MACKYCKNSKNIVSNVYRVPYQSNEIGSSVYVIGSSLILDDCDQGSKIAEINFCPMCGRKLNDKSKLTIYAETDTDYSDEGEE